MEHEALIEMHGMPDRASVDKGALQNHGPMRPARRRWGLCCRRMASPGSQVRQCAADCCTEMTGLTLRLVFYMSILLGGDYVAHSINLLQGDTLWSNVASTAKYLWTGVFATESSDLDGEANEFALQLKLKPGMTVCEMGSADGSLLARVGRHVMPGGSLVATAPKKAELAATRAAVAAAGIGSVRTYQATAVAWAPGLPPHTCDAIYSRMVIHMVDQRVIQTYIPQWAEALKLGGRMFMTDHNPDDGGHAGRAPGPWGWGRGQMRPICYRLYILPMMYVLPQEAEVAMVKAGGFRLIDGPFAHPYFQGGYGAVYTPAGHPHAPVRSALPPPTPSQHQQEHGAGNYETMKL